LDRTLAEKFRKGSHSAFEELYSMHADNAFRLAAAILKNHTNAKDIVQVSFVRAYEYRKSFNPMKSFSFWFNRILVNECRRYMAQVKKKREILEYDEYMSEISTEDSYKFEKYEMLYSALQKLHDDMRIPLLLKYINGFKEDEIAEIMNLRRSTVKSRLYEGRQRVKRYLLDKGFKEYHHE